MDILGNKEKRAKLKASIEKLKEKYPELSFSCFYDEPGMEVAGYY